MAINAYETVHFTKVLSGTQI